MSESNKSRKHKAKMASVDAPVKAMDIITTLSAVAFGYTVEVEFPASTALTPATAATAANPTPVTGFTVFVNGVPRRIVRAQVKGALYHTLRTVKLTLDAPVRFGDTVSVSYQDGNLVEVDTTVVPEFYRWSAENQTPFVPSPFFDPEYWLRTESDPPAGDLFERRIGYPLASVILDTTPPTGEVTLNENLGAGGVQCHHFAVLDGNANEILTGMTVVQDSLDRTVREAADLGGAEQEFETETIGSGSAHSLLRIFPKTGGQYPLVGSIEVGMTAAKAKGYLVEGKQSPADSWKPIVFMIADTRTREYFRYNFASAVRLYAVRLRYRGDFYTPTATGTATVAGYDALTDVAGVQLSHYPDFRDAADFPQADADGWISFSEGESVFDWDMINQKRLWQPQPGKGTSAFKFILPFGESYIAFDATSAYLPDAVGGLVKYTVTSGTITSATVHLGKVYVGTSDGKLYVSTSGENYTLLNAGVTLPAITAMASYSNKLYFGTDSDGSGRILIYVVDGATLTFQRYIALTREGDGVVVPLTARCMASAKGYLYLGVGGATSSGAAMVYVYDGTTWLLTLSASEYDAVEAMAYTATNERFWAGLAGGAVYSLGYGSDNKPTSWRKEYDGDAAHYLNFRDDPSGDFLWLCTNSGMIAYVASEQAFVDVTLPATFTAGLTETTDGTIKTLSGYLRADYTDTYTFYLTGSNEASLSIGGVEILTSEDGMEENVNRDMVAGQWVPFELTYDTASSGTYTLKWAAANIPKQTVASYAFATTLSGSSTTNVADVAYSGLSGPYGAAADGRVYLLDTGTIASRERAIYVRFKDVAGNVTPMPGMYDTVFQDTEKTSEGVRVSDGRIYQVTTDKEVVATFSSSVAKALLAPDRRQRQTGYYESEPFYVATLTKWDTISFLATLASTAAGSSGLDSGLQIDLYVRADDDRDALLAKDWGTAFTRTTIDNPSGVGSAVTSEFSIESIIGKWLQFKLVLTTASRNVSPIVEAVTLSYKAANATYFFSALFDTSAEVSVPPYPQFRRFLLTANMVPNGGLVQFGYTTDDSVGGTFDFNRYTPITPNAVMELPEPSEKIRFGVLLVSVGDTPAVVNEYAVQLDAGADDMLLMKST